MSAAEAVISDTEPAYAHYAAAVMRARDATALVFDDLPPLLPGAVPEAIEIAGLAALCWPVPKAWFDQESVEHRLGDPDWVAARALAHHRLVEALAPAGPAVPLRFGSVHAERDGVITMLHSRAARWTAALDRLDGAAEWTLTVETAAHGPGAGEASPSAAASGAAYLKAQARARNAAAERQSRLRNRLTALHETLSRYARAVTIRDPGKAARAHGAPPPVFRAAYLLPHGDIDVARCVCADRAAAWADDGVRLALDGPLPAFVLAPLLLEGSNDA